MLEPRLTPLSLFAPRAADKENALAVEPRPIHFAPRERYGATPVRGAFALCVTPTLPGGSRVNPLVRNHSLARVAPVAQGDDADRSDIAGAMQHTT
jgi:hypothetical protein